MHVQHLPSCSWRASGVSVFDEQAFKNALGNAAEITQLVNQRILGDTMASRETLNL